MTLTELKTLHSQGKAISGQSYSAKDKDGKILYFVGTAEGRLKVLTSVPVKSTVTNNNNSSSSSSSSGGSGGSSGSITDLLIDFIATAAVPVFVLVTSTGVPADSTDVTHRNKVIGISTTAVSSGFAGKAVGFGQIKNPAWSWTIGDKLFLNGTTISTTAPSTGFSQMIGIANKSDTIDVDIHASILL